MGRKLCKDVIFVWKLYDRLLEQLPDGGRVTGVCSTDFWTMAQTDQGGLGLAMTTLGDTRPAMLEKLEGLPLAEAARVVKSWNLPEASAGMAAINACYNTRQRLEALRCAERYDHYCTHGLDLTGKTIGVVGHLKMPEDTLRLAKDVFILERHPQPGDYPDSACEYLLPKCDVVIITGSAFVNKTLPRLLELSRRAYTIVTGPTVPLCPELLGEEIQRLAGLVLTDLPGITGHVESGLPGPPYRFGQTFLLSEDRL